MSIFGFKILSRLIQSTFGDLARIPKSNEILTMPVESQKSFQNFWVNFDCTFIDISKTNYIGSNCGRLFLDLVIERGIEEKDYQQNSIKLIEYLSRIEALEKGWY